MSPIRLIRSVPKLASERRRHGRAQDESKRTRAVGSVWSCKAGRGVFGKGGGVVASELSAGEACVSSFSKGRSARFGASVSWAKVEPGHGCSHAAGHTEVLWRAVQRFWPDAGSGAFVARWLRGGS